MKKLLSLLSALAVVIGLASCEKETTKGGGAQKDSLITTISATSGETTRVMVVPGTGSDVVDQVLWAAGDQIVFFEVADEAAGTYVNDVKEIFSLVSGEGTKSAEFCLESGNGLDPTKTYKAFHVKDPDDIKVNSSNSFIHFSAIPSIGSGINGPKYLVASADHNMVNDYAIFAGNVTFPNATTASVVFENSLMSILEFHISLQSGATDFAIDSLTITETSGQGNNFFSLLEIKGTSINSGYTGNYAAIHFDTPFNASDNKVIRVPIIHRFTGSNNPYSFTLSFFDADNANRAGSVTSTRSALEKGRTYVWPVAAKAKIDYTLPTTDWKMAASSYYYSTGNPSLRYPPKSIIGNKWQSVEIKGATGPESWKELPSWCLIDMGSMQTFNKISLSRTGGSTRDTKQVAIWAAKDYNGAGIEIPATNPVPSTGFSDPQGWAWNVLTDAGDIDKMQAIQNFVDSDDTGINWQQVATLDFLNDSAGPDDISGDTEFEDPIKARFVLVKITKITGRGGMLVGGNVANFKLKYVSE